jgi:hypothetical protein
VDAAPGPAARQHPLLARAAGLTRASRPAGGALGLAAGVAELAEDLAEPVVHLFEDGGPLVEIDLVEVGKPLDGLIDPGIPGRGESRPSRFCVHYFPSPWLRITSAVPAVRYPPA